MMSSSLSQRASRAGESPQPKQNAAVNETRPGIWPLRHAQTSPVSKSYTSHADKHPASDSVVHRYDAKVLMWILPHAVVPLALWSLDTLPVARLSNPVGVVGSGTLYFVFYILIQAIVGTLYYRLYGSNPGVLTNGVPAPGPPQLSCTHCGVFPSLRSKHDRVIGYCVHKYDHYCWFLSTAIGDLNHRAFLCYLATQLTLILMVLGSLFQRVLPCLHPHQPHPLPSTPASMCHPMTPLDALLISTCAASALVAAGFFGQKLVLHTYLAATNQTTLELLRGADLMYMRGYYLSHHGPRKSARVTGPALLQLLWRHLILCQPPPMPFSQGLRSNLKVFFLAPKPYDYSFVIPFKDLVEYRPSEALPSIASDRFTADFIPAGQADPETGGALALLLPDSEDDSSQLLPKLSAVAASKWPR